MLDYTHKKVLEDYKDEMKQYIQKKKKIAANKAWSQAEKEKRVRNLKEEAKGEANYYRAEFTSALEYDLKQVKSFVGGEITPEIEALEQLKDISKNELEIIAEKVNQDGYNHLASKKLDEIRKDRELLAGVKVLDIDEEMNKLTKLKKTRFNGMEDGYSKLRQAMRLPKE